MNIIKLTLTMVCLSALSIPVTAKSDSAEVAIKATINSLVSGLNEKNIRKIHDTYAEKAMLVPTQAEILDDNSQIVSFWHNQLNKGKCYYRIDIIDLHVNRNIARMSAMWTASITTGGASTRIVDGYMTNVLERQADGHWKIRIQNWN